MTVYVDNMKAKFGRMIMCHMIADTDEELHAMAARIGVARRWHQTPPKASTSHYDVALQCRALAVAAGAIEITQRQTAAMAVRRRATGKLGSPADAEAWHRAYIAAGRPQGFQLEADERPALTELSIADVCSLMMACAMSEDRSDQEFAQACREEIKRRKPEPVKETT